MTDATGTALLFGKVPVKYSVTFRNRKHMAISVHPDSRITVTAPTGTSMQEVQIRVGKRAPWILKQLEHFERFHPLPTPRRYVNGETHRYLGRQYRLKIEESPEESVKLLGRYLTVNTTDPSDSDQVRRLVEGWYRSRAEDLFNRQLTACLNSMKGFRDTRPPLTIRRMKTRWGSCSQAGRILLNVELVRAPVECINYVITHELCHLKVPNHSPRFFRLLTRHIPDWPRRKKRLEQMW